MSTITTNNGTQYKTPSFWQTAGAIYAGATATSMINSSGQIIGPHIIKGMQKANGQIKDKVELRNAINKAIEISGVKDKGVELIDLSGSKTSGRKRIFDYIQKTPFAEGAVANEAVNWAEKPVAIKDYALKKALLTEMPEWVKKTPLGKIYASMIGETLKSGGNACFLPKSNKCVVNIDKLGTAAFHEIGHSINANMSKFWKVMQKMRTPAMLLGFAIPSVGLFKRKKVEGEEPKGVFDKVTTFIKDNCGKLTTLAFVPVVAEELMATRRGNKLAKQLLNPELYKKVVISNRFGAASYIFAALSAGVGAFAGSKVRDYFTKPKLVKAEVQPEQTEQANA